MSKVPPAYIIATSWGRGFFSFHDASRRTKEIVTRTPKQI